MHPNLKPSPLPPEEGWTSNLADLPAFTYPSLYKHLADAANTGPGAQDVADDFDSTDSDSDGKDSDTYLEEEPTPLHGIAQARQPTGDAGQTGSAAADETHISSFRGLWKGFRFFKDSHIQAIEFHPLPDTPELCMVRAKVLPSMVKTRQCSVRLCLTTEGDVHTA